MKKIALIGSTGSIGRQAIKVAENHPDKFKIVALVANSSRKEFLKQVAAVKPLYAALCSDEAAAEVNELPAGVTFLSGNNAGLTALEECGADVVLNAASGFAGLGYCLKAIDLGLPVALANKESLVCGGDVIAGKAAEIMPVDSEHSAIWQCLGFNRFERFKSLVITASGGAFRGRAWESLKEVTPEMALAHPTWKMGKKITIDSATLLNKGYEVIEAHHLFNCPFEKIRTVIHPQSIIHSMVQFADGATLAQLSYPSMELPIQLALTYPDRYEGELKTMDFDSVSALTFEPLERKAYPMYDLALTCGEAGGILPAALNAASEVAVNAFLKGGISFTDIHKVAANVVDATVNCKAESLKQLTEVDVKARMLALNQIK